MSPSSFTARNTDIRFPIPTEIIGLLMEVENANLKGPLGRGHTRQRRPERIWRQKTSDARRQAKIRASRDGTRLERAAGVQAGGAGSLRVPVSQDAGYGRGSERAAKGGGRRAPPVRLSALVHPVTARGLRGESQEVLSSLS